MGLGFGTGKEVFFFGRAAVAGKLTSDGANFDFGEIVGRCKGVWGLGI